MEQNSLSIETRNELGKGAARRARRAGKLPGVLYGRGQHTSVTVDPRIIQRILLTEGGRNKVFNLAGQGLEGRSALIKDYQVDPVSRELLHVDLLEIDVSQKIQVTVTLNFVGKAAGVGEGGVLNIIGREVDIYCLPNAIPGHIDVDVSPLAIGDSIHAEDLKLPEGVELGTTSNPTLCTVVPPTREEEAAPSLTPTAEPEVITAKKPEEAAAGEKKDEKKK